MEIYDCFDNCNELCFQCGYDEFPLASCVKKNRIERLHDGESCGHTGCLNHVTHPCEYCGRIAGRRIVENNKTVGFNATDKPEEAYTVKSKLCRQTRWDIRFLELCKFFATRWSKDPSTQCGSVIVRDVNKFVSLGYNGYPAGVKDDDSLHHRETKYAKVIHAEKNAILFAQRDVSGMTLYVWPLPPCSQCASYIIQSGIKRVVSVIPSDKERKERWLESNAIAFDMLKQAGIELKLYDEGEVK